MCKVFEGSGSWDSGVWDVGVYRIACCVVGGNPARADVVLKMT